MELATPPDDSQPALAIESSGLLLGEYQAKAELIAAACESGDVSAIARLSTEAGGLLNDTLRKAAWPILLGAPASRNENDSTRRSPHVQSWQSLPTHKEEDQVGKDVVRSFNDYPQDESERTRKLRQQELSDVIIETLRRHPELCYFQGFHDIIQVMLLALGKEVAADVVPYLSLLRLRDFMLPSLTATTSQLELIPAILYTSDVELSRLVSLKQLPDPHFAISSILTLYAHNVKSYDEITRLFDFLFAHDAVISLYLFVVVIISRREELLAIDDIDELNVKLSKLPTPLDLEYLISNTTKLFARHPPESLPFRAWSRVSPRSVLKTTRKCLQGSNQGIDPQRLVIAEDLFASHAAQIQRQEFRAKIRKNMAHTIRRYRRPAGSIGLAILIGVVSIWAQRSGIGGVWSGPNEILWSFLGMRDIRQQFWGQQNLRT